MLFDTHIVGSQDDAGGRERERELQLTEAVLAYLKEHPHAMDTLEGIAEWWVNRARIRTDVTLLAKILDEMTKKGLLEAVGTGDQRRYRMRARSHR